MPTLIMITLDDDLNDEQQNDLRYLLSDAVSEFASRRSVLQLDDSYSVDAYIAKRYPADGGYSAQWLADKRAQVARRVKLARDLHGPCLQMKIECGECKACRWPIDHCVCRNY